MPCVRDLTRSCYHGHVSEYKKDCDIKRETIQFYYTLYIIFWNIKFVKYT